MKNFFCIIIIIIIISIIACSPITKPSHEAILMTGLVTNGVLYSNGTVFVKDARGKTVSGKIDDSGHYSISVEGMTPPFVVLAKDEQGNNPLYSGYHDFGTCNISPFTHTIMALSFVDLPENIFPIEHIEKNNHVLSKLPTNEVFKSIIAETKSAFQEIFQTFLSQGTDLMYGIHDEQLGRINGILQIINIEIISQASLIITQSRDLIVKMSFKSNEILYMKINTNDFEFEKIDKIERAAMDFQKCPYYNDIYEALGIEIEEKIIISGTVTDGNIINNGSVYLKDSAGLTLSTIIDNNGKYSFAGENVSPPFILYAQYLSNNEEELSLFSGYYNNHGIVNITPATNTILSIALLDVPEIKYRTNDIKMNGIIVKDIPGALDLEIANECLYNIFLQTIGIQEYSFIYTKLDIEDYKIYRFLNLIRYELKVLDGDFIINFYYKNEIVKFFMIVIPRNSTNEDRINIINAAIAESQEFQNKILEIKEELEE